MKKLFLMFTFCLSIVFGVTPIVDPFPSGDSRLPAFRYMCEEMGKIVSNHSGIEHTCFITYAWPINDGAINSWVIAIKEYLALAGVVVYHDNTNFNGLTSPLEGNCLNVLKNLLILTPDFKEKHDIIKTQLVQEVSIVFNKDSSARALVLLSGTTDTSLPSYEKLGRYVLGTEMINLMTSSDYRNQKPTDGPTIDKFFSVMCTLLDPTKSYGLLTNVNGGYVEFCSKLIETFKNTHLIKVESRPCLLKECRSENMSIQKHMEFVSKKRFLFLYGVTSIVGLAGTIYTCKPKILLPYIITALLLYYNLPISHTMKSNIFTSSQLIERKLCVEKCFKIIEDHKILVISAAGGSGKTTLAKQIGKDVITLEINATDRGKIKDSILYFFEKIEEKKLALKINNSDSDQDAYQKSIEIFSQYIKSKDKWLIILDGLEDFSILDDLKSVGVIQQNIKNGKIIITTQNSIKCSIPEITDRCYFDALELLKEEKKELFLKRINAELKSKYEKNIDVVLDVIPPYTLDIIVAASTLNTLGVSFQEYVQLIAEHNSVVEDYGAGRNGLKSRYSIIKTFIKSLTQKNDGLINELLILSLLDPSDLRTDYIPLNFRWSVIVCLKEKSIARLQDNCFIIHQTFHKILRNILSKEQCLNKEQIIQNLYDSFFSMDNESQLSIVKLKNKLTHLRHFFSVLDELNLAEDFLKRIRWFTLNKIAETNLQIGRFHESLECYHILFKMEEPKNSEKILTRFWMDAASCCWIGDHFEKCIELSKKALTYFEKNNVDLLDIVLCYINIGTAYTYMTQYDDALSEFQEAEKFLKKTDDKSSEKYFSTSSYLNRRVAQFFYIQSAYPRDVEKAFPYIKEAINNIEKIKTSDKAYEADYIRHMCSYIYMLTHAGCFKEAEELFKKVDLCLEKNTEMFDDFMLARIEIERAHLLLRKDDSAKAESLFREYIKQYAEFSGNPNQVSMDVLWVESLIDLARYDEALEILNKYNNVGFFENNIVYVYLCMAQFYKSIIYFKKDDKIAFKEAARYFIESFKHIYVLYKQKFSEQLVDDFFNLSLDDESVLFQKEKDLLSIFYGKNHPLATKY